MNLYEYSLILSILAAAPVFTARMPGVSKRIIVDKMESCEEYTDLPLTLKDMSLVQADRDTYLMNGRMIYNSVIESPWSMDILIEKCESVHNPDSCELWFTYNVPDLCPKLPEKNQVWSNFIEKINMSTHCPMEPNEYIIKDVPIDSSNMQRIPMGKAAFRFHVNSKSKSKVAACIDSEVEIVPEMNKGIGK